MRRPILILCASMVFVAGILSARAGSSSLDRTIKGEGVVVTMSSPFSEVPPGGSVPIRVTIRNDRNYAGSWRIFFTSSAYYSTRGDWTLNQNFTVAPNSSGSFEVLVPVPMVPTNRSGMEANVAFHVAGTGIDNEGAGRQSVGSFFTYSPSTRSPYAILGKDLLGPVGLGPLQDLYKDKKGRGTGMEFYGSEVDKDLLPSDWRAYSGVAAVLLKDSEWLGLNREQRDAICDYVAQGGELTLFTDQNLDSRAPQLQLPEPDGKPGPYGFGTISLASLDASPPAAAMLRDTIEKNHAPSAWDVDQAFTTWGLRLSAGVIDVNATFILTFVLIFGALVGPVNLYVFARGDKRFRLFWTTPLISVLASIVLIIGILFTDGLGGSGQQMMAIYSLPGASRQVMIQEQVAHTAVLFSNRWNNDQNYQITPISADAMRGALGTEERRRTGHLLVGSGNRDDSSNSYYQEGNTLSGSWFRSRSIAGQYLQAMSSSRSTLMMVNANALHSSQQPPMLLSSFPGELDEVYLVDNEGNYWSCDHLEPGEKKTCKAASVSEYEKFWEKATGNAGGKLLPALKAAAARPGCFYATGLPAEHDALATLPEIRWRVANGVYLGPWVASPAPESAQ